MNASIIPAVTLLFIGGIYRDLYAFSQIKIGLDHEGLTGVLMGVFSLMELQLVFLLMSGYWLVRAFQRLD
jgi:hypothetical protein